MKTKDFFEEYSVTSVLRAFCTIQGESEKEVSVDVLEVLKEKAILEVMFLETQESFETEAENIDELAIAMKKDWENGMDFDGLKEKYGK